MLSSRYHHICLSHIIMLSSRYYQICISSRYHHICITAYPWPILNCKIFAALGYLLRINHHYLYWPLAHNFSRILGSFISRIHRKNVSWISRIAKLSRKHVTQPCGCQKLVVINLIPLLSCVFSGLWKYSQRILLDMKLYDISKADIQCLSSGLYRG